jgi:hypothetical protein
MRGWLFVETAPAYEAWLARAATDSRLRYDAAAAHDGWDWETGR